MTEKRKKELDREIVAFAQDAGNTLYDTPRKIMQEVANDINNHILPIHNSLTPFYIAALECIAQTLRAHFPKESALADDLKDELTCYGIVIPRTKNQ